MAQTRTAEESAEVYGAASAFGKSNYMRGWAPYAAVLASLKLPPRGKRGSAVNRRRAKMVADALKREARRRRNGRAVQS